MKVYRAPDTSYPPRLLARKYADIHGSPEVFMHHEFEAPPSRADVMHSFKGTPQDWKRLHETMNEHDYGHPQGEPAEWSDAGVWAWVAGGVGVLSWLVIWLMNRV